MPTLAKIAVSAANTAESSAQKIQAVVFIEVSSIYCLNYGYFAGCGPPDGPGRMRKEQREGCGAFGASGEFAQAANDLETLHDVDRVSERTLSERERRPHLASIAQGEDRAHPRLGVRVTERMDQALGIGMDRFPRAGDGAAARAWSRCGISRDGPEALWTEILHRHTFLLALHDIGANGAMSSSVRMPHRAPLLFVLEARYGRTRRRHKKQLLLRPEGAC
jgi:hypothetical protein